MKCRSGRLINDKIKRLLSKRLASDLVRTLNSSRRFKDRVDLVFLALEQKPGKANCCSARL
jgi:hypothetical protein